MTDAETSLALEAYPDPALAYDRTEDRAFVEAVNDQFCAVFDEPDPDTPVADVLDRFRTADAIVDDVLEALDGGTCQDIRLRITDTAQSLEDSTGEDNAIQAGEYLIRVVPAGEDHGHLLFVDCDALATATGSDGSDRLTSVLTHDFRNLLDVADANLYVARTDGDEDCFDQVESAHDRMERLLDDVLTLARGAEPIDPSTTVDLGTLVERAWETVTPADGTLVVEDALPETTADPDHASRLIENLIRNALDHSDDTTTITVGTLEDGAGFYVADDGPGIPPADRQRVFERGYTDRESGTGLGLTIVSRIAAAHGWRVDLTTSDDGGARFDIVFDSHATGADTTDTS